MTTRRRRWLLPATAVTMLALFAGALAELLVARRESARSTMPDPLASAEPAAPPERSPGPGKRDLGSGVAVRLIDRLSEAKIRTPSLAERQVRGLLVQHWRRYLSPFTGPGGHLASLVQSVSLQRQEAGSADREKALPAADASARRRVAATTGNSRQAGRERPSRGPTVARGQPSDRDIHTFGLGEGTYDQRECIVAPPPSSLRFKLRIPKGSRFRVAPAVLGEGTSDFAVLFHPSAGGAPRLLGTSSLRGPTRRFNDWTIDLEAAGIGEADGELELTTSATSREPVVALWGTPVVMAPVASQLPYNLLFVIVDAMRSDAVADSHDPAQDAARKAAKHSPLEAWFPAMPEVAPELDRLAERGAIWEQSWSAAMWTRPATVSILTGLRASHAGLDVLALELIGDQRRNFYARKPPLLPLTMRRGGATTAAVVNNMYLSGAVGVGVDFGFETVVDHRFQALDTSHITADALRFLSEHSAERFFLLLNFASPHAPYVPPPADLRAVRAAVERPSDPTVLNYLAEVHKDDAAIGRVLRKLDDLGLRDKTIVVVTADHGETMSAAHDMVAVDVAQGVPSGRFTHLSTMWEEAARVAMLIALPGRVPAAYRAKSRVQTIDLYPTILELEDLPIPEELDGRSLLGELAGKPGAARPIVIEGRGARSVIDGKYHLIVRDPVARRLRNHKEEFERAVELYDLESDPGERKDIAPQSLEIVAELRSKLERALTKKLENAGAGPKQRLHLRFATASSVGRVEIRLELKSDGIQVSPSGIDPRAIEVERDEIRVSFNTSLERAVGFDLELPSTIEKLPWSVTLDGKPWPPERIYAGVLGMAERELARGLEAGFDRYRLDSRELPHIVAGEETGMFVTREPQGLVAEEAESIEAQLEAQEAMHAWGYAKRPSAKSR